MNDYISDEVNQGLINWVKIYQKDPRYAVSWPLSFGGFKNIAIYNLNDIGAALAWELMVRCGVNVKYLLDDERSISVAGKKTVSLTSVDRIDDVDVIIVCDEKSADIEKSVEKLKSKTDAQIRTFGWLLDRRNHYTLTIRPMVQLAYYLRQRGVEFYFIAMASLTTTKNLSTREKMLRDNGIWGYQQMIPLLKPEVLKSITEPILNGKIGFEEFRKGIVECSSKVATTYKNGNLMFQDMRTKYINFVNGNRFTTDNPQNYSNKVVFYGDSTAVSYNTQDSDTIPSYFQRLLNREFGDRYLVQNYATPFGKGHMLDRILDTDFQPGDMVFCVNSYDVQYDLPQVCEEAGLDYLNTNFLFDRPHNYGEVFADIEHFAAFGNEIIANLIWDVAVKHKEEKRALNPDFDISAIYEEISNRKRRRKNEIEESEEFKNYLIYLESIRKETEGTVGSIVVNCNPYTLGHQYLIEYASKQVDLLYIFVVEEDASDFPFKDRIELVRKGTAHLKNVEVLPSGRFIISNLTFPDYFTKGKSKNVTIDVSNDVELFANHIARILGITKRFVGTEPNCAVTKQYNDYMSKELPEKGIDFIEIERKVIGDSPVSASRVRELLKIGDFDEISKIVPPSTLDYLKTLI